MFPYLTRSVPSTASHTVVNAAFLLVSTASCTHFFGELHPDTGSSQPYETDCPALTKHTEYLHHLIDLYFWLQLP